MRFQQSTMAFCIAYAAIVVAPIFVHAQTRYAGDMPIRSVEPYSGYGMDQSDSGYRNYYPAAELQIIPPAAAQAANARAQFRRADAALATQVRDLKTDFLTSPEMTRALASLQDAQDAYETVCRIALRGVRNDPRYQAYRELEQDIARHLAERRNDRHAREEEIASLAQLKMNYATRASDMEIEALEAQPQVLEARQKLVETGRELSAMQADFEKSVRNNPDLLAARNVLEDTRIARVTSATYLNSALKVAETALDYAYDQSYNDRYIPHVYGYSYPYSYRYSGSTVRAGW